jgi:NADPH:quinone reductase-like Zn-dependent oxidoreductase
VFTEGYILGSEGSGIVEDVGVDVDRSLIGNKVSFFGNGWSTFHIQHLSDCFFLDQQLDLKTTANAYINPLTSLGMLYYTKHIGKSNAVIMTGASSSLAKMFNKLCKRENLKVINVVRKEN